MLFSLKEQGITIHFILLCETFLSNANAHLFPIAGNNFVHKSRSQLTRGGVAIYILDGFNYTERLDLCINVEFIGYLTRVSVCLLNVLIR